MADLQKGASRDEGGSLQQTEGRRQPLSALDENLTEQPSKGNKAEREAGTRARKRQRSLSAAAAAPVRPNLPVPEDSDDDFV